MTTAELQPAHLEALTALFQRLPESDLTFIKEDVSPQAVQRWVEEPGRRWVELEDGAVVGYAAIKPLLGWSDHVAELRLVVDPAVRGRGTGRLLTQHAVLAAVRSGFLKVLVELPATQERTIRMFHDLGFSGEAILRDHFRDRSGRLHDLIMMAHLAEPTLETLSAVGIADLVEEADAP